MLFPGACAWQAAIHHWGLHSSVCSSECPFRSPQHSLHTQPTFSYSCHYYIKWFCSLMFPCRCLSSLQTVNSVKAGQCLSSSPLCSWCLEQSREQESFLKCLSGGGGAIMWSTQKGQGGRKTIKVLKIGGAWMAQSLGVCLQLRAWSWSSGIEPPSGSSAGRLLLPLPLPLLVFPLSLAVSIFVE